MVCALRLRICWRKMAQNILLIAGGDSSEHEISLISAQYLMQELSVNPEFNLLSVVLHDGKFQFADGSYGYFTCGRQFALVAPDGTKCEVTIDCVVPCLHGFPGETGDIQSFLELQGVPYIGCKAEASRVCFNKVTTKFYLDALKIENTPSIFVSDSDEASLKAVHEAFARFGHDVYVKAASQGSSIGCYHITQEEELDQAIRDALKLSELVLVEKTIEHRELEVAAFEYEGRLVVTEPGEIVIPSDKFYTYDEKYSKDSGTTTTVEVEGLTPVQREMIKSMATRAFKGLKLRHLSRIDFFLASDGTVLINEINTFPGMTPISMFPKLMEHIGIAMSDFLTGSIRNAIAEQRSRA